MFTLATGHRFLKPCSCIKMSPIRSYCANISIPYDVLKKLAFVYPDTLKNIIKPELFHRDRLKSTFNKHTNNNNEIYRDVIDNPSIKSNGNYEIEKLARI